MIQKLTRVRAWSPFTNVNRYNTNPHSPVSTLFPSVTSQSLPFELYRATYTSEHYKIAKTKHFPLLRFSAAFAAFTTFGVLKFANMPRRGFQTATLNAATTDVSLTGTDDAPPKSIPSTFDDSLPLPSLIVIRLASKNSSQMTRDMRYQGLELSLFGGATIISRFLHKKHEKGDQNDDEVQLEQGIVAMHDLVRRRAKVRAAVI